MILRYFFDRCSTAVRDLFDNPSTSVRLAFDRPSTDLRQRFGKMPKQMVNNCRTNALLYSNQPRAVNGLRACGKTSCWRPLGVGFGAWFELRANSFGARSTRIKPRYDLITYPPAQIGRAQV